MNIGNALRDIRQTIAGRRQNDVANATGLSQTYLSQIESGKKIPSQEVIEILCKEYKVPVPIVIWQAMDISDVAKEKQKAFKTIKPIVDDLLAGFLVNNY